MCPHLTAQYLRRKLIWEEPGVCLILANLTSAFLGGVTLWALKLDGLGLESSWSLIKGP